MNMWRSLLLAIILQLKSAAAVTCRWPDWSPETCAQPACPDCSKIKRDYGETCFDPQDNSQYPDYFIEDTVELACSTVGSAGQISERVLGISWVPSQKSPAKEVPLIESLSCYDDLACTSGNCSRLSVSDYGKTYPCSDFHVDYRGWLLEDVLVDQPDCTLHFWEPSCDRTSGVYLPVQLKSHGSTFGAYRWCSSPLGDRLFGQEGYNTMHKETNMTCACSRKVWELSQRKVTAGEEIPERQDVTLHCEPNGNYESLQCDLGRCWCVDPSGKVTSPVVPETLWEMLPCYTANNPAHIYGKQYIRRCESRVQGINKAKELFQKRGTQWTIDAGVECDPDGSFFRRQCDNRGCYCVDRTNQNLRGSVTLQDKSSMNCRCDRDQAEGYNQEMVCDARGNYPTLRNQIGMDFCSDPDDGWRTSGKVNDQEHKPDNGKPCCLDLRFNNYSCPTSTPNCTETYFGWLNCRQQYIMDNNDTYCDIDQNNCNMASCSV